MLHHPAILIPKLLLLAVVVIALVFLRGVLSPGQFAVAVLVAALVVLAGSAAIWAMALKALANPESRISKASVLSHQARAEDGFRASADTYADLVGEQGTALSNLNPAGTALIAGKRLPVMTHAEFVEKDSPIEVVETKGAKIIVTAKGVAAPPPQPDERSEAT